MEADNPAPIGRAGQPIEVATPFVFLASADSSYFTAQVSSSSLVEVEMMLIVVFPRKWR